MKFRKLIRGLLFIIGMSTTYLSYKLTLETESPIAMASTFLGIFVIFLSIIILSPKLDTSNAKGEQK